VTFQAAKSFVCRNNHVVYSPVHFGWRKIIFTTERKPSSLHSGSSFLPVIVDPICIRIALFAENFWSDEVVCLVSYICLWPFSAWESFYLWQFLEKVECSPNNA